MSGWVGVDLDGTLARYDGWQGVEHIGDPIGLMVERVRLWLERGLDVRVFTARVYGDGRAAALPFIEAWCLEHLGMVVPVTNEKDHGMVELWDDRAVQIECNTGRRMDGAA